MKRKLMMVLGGVVFGGVGCVWGGMEVAEGYEVSVAVPASLVARPVEACFDDAGRLYVTEVTGTNEPAAVQLEKAPHRLVRLEDTDGDGEFDRRVVFAEKLGFPEGVLWHEGVVYVSVAPQILRLVDRDGDGVADERTVWFDGKTLTGCANDLHGPYAGPDGMIYWCKGAFGEQTHDLPGKKGWRSRAAHVFRMKPDGSGLDVVFTAGMDNPVGLAWTAEGDLMVCGTFLQHPGDGRRDGIIHAVRGGLWGKDHDVLEGHVRTGPLLPPMTHLGPAAPAGMCRYGRDLLVCQFNLRKVSRHELEPDGATWKTKDSDLLSSDDPDFHPTDVLQAADGSVLVVDTGGWYKLCCPTSQEARPEVTGGVYRLRRKGGEVPVAVPEARSRLVVPEEPKELLEKAGSEDPGEREQAIGELLRPLAEQAKSADGHVRRRAIEALGQWSGQHADPGAGRGGMGHLAAAARGVTSALLGAMEGRVLDRFTEHALTVALIEGADAKGPRVLLHSADPVRQRMGLYWVMQTDPEMFDVEGGIGEFLGSGDAGVREAAVFGLGKVGGGREEAERWLEGRLGKAGIGVVELTVVRAVMRGAGDETVARWLRLAEVREARLVLLAAMAEVREGELPASWLRELRVLLGGDELTARAAAEVLASRRAGVRDAGVRAVAADRDRPVAVRLSLLVAAGKTELAEEEFGMVVKALTERGGLGECSDRAARVLSLAVLTGGQLRALVPVVAEVALPVRPLLLRAFGGSGDEATGMELVEVLGKSGALAGFSAEDLGEGFRGFPASVRERLAATRAALVPGLAEVTARVAELERTLPAGDALRGKVVFQSAKASCVLCHQAGYLGKAFGPDLTKVGVVRTRRDLIEAIAFPSASFVRSFEPVEVVRRDGTVVVGMVVNQSAEMVTLATGAVTPPVTVAAVEIAEMRVGKASLMPQGLDRILTVVELADVVAFLESLK
jgi:putative heme-binding domain-containing protein